MGSIRTSRVRSTFRFVARFSFPCLFLSLTALGCGAGKGDVTGKVTFDGKTVVWGTVSFEGPDGLIHHGNIGRDGSYSIAGVGAGIAKVAVSSINPKSSDFQPIQREGRPAPPPPPDIPDWFPIPKKFDMISTSGLSYPVKSGKNVINVEMTKE